MTRKRNQIISLFGEIETLVAKQMMAEGQAVFILAPTASVSLEDIPEQVRFNESGDKVRMVIVMPPQCVMEFERRIDDSRF
jgi:hypothetical protein